MCIVRERERRRAARKLSPRQRANSQSRDLDRRPRLSSSLGRLHPPSHKAAAAAAATTRRALATWSDRASQLDRLICNARRSLARSSLSSSIRPLSDRQTNGRSPSAGSCAMPHAAHVGQARELPSPGQCRPRAAGQLSAGRVSHLDPSCRGCALEGDGDFMRPLGWSAQARGATLAWHLDDVCYCSTRDSAAASSSSGARPRNQRERRRE